MNDTNFLLLVANLYHQVAVVIQVWQPALAQYYETMSQNLFSFLRAAGIGI